MTEPFDEEPGQGSLGEEAARLLSVVQDWAVRTFPSPSGHPDAPQDGHAGSDCRWCPLCQFVAVLRGERPEVSERVAEAGSAVVAALRAFVEAAAPAAGSAGAHRHPDAGAARPRVQRIDLGAEPDGVPPHGD